MGVNSLPKTVTRQRRECDLNSGPTAPESSTLTTRLSSHLPEVRNSQRCQRRTEPRPQAARTEDLLKFGHLVSEICAADRHAENEMQYAFRRSSHP